MRFVTPILHPNVDGGGRICLDTLSLPPGGAWRPSLSLGAALAAVRSLLSEPNGDDGLVEEVAHEFRHARAAFDARARAMTRRHATGGGGGRKEGEEKVEGGAAAEEQRENAKADSPAPAAGKEREEGEASSGEKAAAEPAAAAPAAAAPVSRLQLGVKRPRAGENE